MMKSTVASWGHSGFEFNTAAWRTRCCGHRKTRDSVALVQPGKRTIGCVHGATVNAGVDNAARSTRKSKSPALPARFLRLLLGAALSTPVFSAPHVHIVT